MKKVLAGLCIFAALILLQLSSVHAVDDNPDRFILAKLSYDNDIASTEESKPAKKTVSLPIDYYNTNDTDYISRKNKLGYGQGRPGMTNEMFRSHITGQNLPGSIVNNVAFNLSTKGKRHKGIDIGLPSGPGDVFQFGSAFMTSLVAHELGHEVVANNVGARGSQMNFFTNQDGNFFLGTSTVEEIDANSRLPYHMGGEFFADITFEHALKSYRENPTTYNKTLMFFSGMDFTWYCMYAFYLADDHSHYDPVSVQEETGLSRDTIFSIALAKTMINAYRVYSGQDRVVPYFTVDRHSANLNLAITF